MTNELFRRVRERLWEREPASANERQLLQLGRYVVVIGRDLLDGQLSMRAMSLVYTTLLSLVPVLALAFSLFKALGIHNALEPTLLNVLAPLGAQGAEIVQMLIRFVENIKVGVLGSLGVGLLLYTVISMVQKIEASFNFVWRIAESRRFSQRFGEYLSVLIVGPVLVFLALGITASVLNSDVVAKFASIEPFGALIYVLGKLVPYALIVVAFTFLYAFIPNTRVRIRPALAGGLLAGILWQTGSAAFAAFVARATNYNLIYSGFAILIFLLIWLYLGWLILLIGCQLSYYVQHPERLTPTRIAPYLSGRLAELLGIQVTALVGRRFIAGQEPLTLEDLRRTLPAAPEHVERVVEILLHNGVLAETGAEGQQLQPGRDLEGLSVGELWQTIRRGFDGATSAPRGPSAKDINGLLERVEADFGRSAGNQSVRAWLTGEAHRKDPSV